MRQVYRGDVVKHGRTNYKFFVCSVKKYEDKAFIQPHTNNNTQFLLITVSELSAPPWTLIKRTCFEEGDVVVVRNGYNKYEIDDNLGDGVYTIRNLSNFYSDPFAVNGCILEYYHDGYNDAGDEPEEQESESDVAYVVYDKADNSLTEFSDYKELKEFVAELFFENGGEMSLVAEDLDIYKVDRRLSFRVSDFDLY